MVGFESSGIEKGNALRMSPPETCSPFEFFCRTRVVCGVGAASTVGQVAAQLPARRVLLITDPGVRQAGHVDRCLAALLGSGCTVEVFDQVRENPSSRDVALGADRARAFEPDGLVALGGGSVMDCAKGINFVHTNGGVIEDYWGYGKAKAPLLPAIALPTTAGTGSEVQSYALISRDTDGTKMACGDAKAAFAVAILDVSLLRTCPRAVAVLAGVDALSHAVESYVAKAASPLSKLLSREAFHLLASGLPVLRSLSPAIDLEGPIAERLQLGAMLAGLAIENSMLGAAHALANPLTARFKVPHGHAVILMLPHVIRFNATVCRQDYAELGRILRTASLATPGVGETMPWRLPPSGSRKSPPDLSEPSSHDGELAAWVASLARELGLPMRLVELGIAQSALPSLSRDAAVQWTGNFNPRPFSELDALALYEQAL